jgi:hypothetical protein
MTDRRTGSENQAGQAEAQAAAKAFAKGGLTIDPEAGEYQLPPRELAEQPSMVVRSLRLPLDLDQRIKAAAAARGMSFGALLREWAEFQLAELENDQPISRADALRALAALRPLTGGHAA